MSLCFATEIYWVHYERIPSGFRLVSHTNAYDKVTRYTNDTGITIPGRGREYTNCYVAYQGTEYYKYGYYDPIEVKRASILHPHAH